MGNLIDKNKKEEATAWGINQKSPGETLWASRGQVLGNVATQEYDNTLDKPTKKQNKKAKKKSGDKSAKKPEERRNGSITETGSVSVSTVSGSGPLYPWKQEAGKDTRSRIEMDTKIDCRGRKVKSQSTAAVNKVEQRQTSEEVYWKENESAYGKGKPTYTEAHEDRLQYSKDSSVEIKHSEPRRHQLYFGQQDYYDGY